MPKEIIKQTLIKLFIIFSNNNESPFRKLLMLDLGLKKSFKEISIKKEF